MALLGCEVDVIAQDRMLKCKHNETAKIALSIEISKAVNGDSQWRDRGKIKIKCEVLWLWMTIGTMVAVAMVNKIPIQSISKS